VAAPRHTHPGEEIIYVLEGTLEYQVEGQPPKTLKAGDVLFIPAGTIHSARNVGTGHAAELATYIVEKENPCSCRPSKFREVTLVGQVWSKIQPIHSP